MVIINIYLYHFSSGVVISVTGLECLSNEPLMVTSSADNNLKVWIFDQSDGGARLLHRRQGHSAPVSHVRFYDDINMIRYVYDCYTL